MSLSVTAAATDVRSRLFESLLANVRLINGEDPYQVELKKVELGAHTLAQLGSVKPSACIVDMGEDEDEETLNRIWFRLRFDVVVYAQGQPLQIPPMRIYNPYLRDLNIALASGTRVFNYNPEGLSYNVKREGGMDALDIAEANTVGFVSSWEVHYSITRDDPDVT
jgi:hypothetical protein